MNPGNFIGSRILHANTPPLIKRITCSVFSSEFRPIKPAMRIVSETAADVIGIAIKLGLQENSPDNYNYAQQRLWPRTLEEV
ncbi:hypothetical protein GGS24DRAFT_456020 [Hypoxylon argillaceum]|nr:hypothetical protein GGS24DRAFT_456020 [Hypoxylon argillaceum]KAI1156239.1 hypothetical protein F4825DRAFT_318503 [Nemania diffusa]